MERHARRAAITRDLVALGERIERLAVDPASVRPLWAGLARPVLRALRARPRVRTARLEALLDTLRALEAPDAPRRGPALPKQPSALRRELDRRADAALRELAASVASAERACVAHRDLPIAFAAWLQRLHQIVARATTATLDLKDRGARRVAAGTPRAALRPPLQPAEPEVMTRRVELELAAIDRIIEAAQAEASFLGRRRRLLEAARVLLLDAAAKRPLERDGAAQRRDALAQEIARVNRLEAAGLSPDVALLHQARAALSRGDGQRLHAALVALDGAAVASGDAGAASRLGDAFGRLWGGDKWRRAAAAAASMDQSAAQVLGAPALDAVKRGYEQGRRALRPPAADAPAADREAYRLALDYLADGAERATVAAALAVDGCFDVGGALSPVRVAEITLRARAVAHPTPDMLLVPARSVADLPGAVIEDPRAVIPSLATGRLLTRRYIQEERVTRKRTRFVGEVRVYLLDGSTSMLTDGHPGARARVRDAVLLAELSTLLRRFAEAPLIASAPPRLAPRAGPGRAAPAARVALYYRYFTRRLGQVTRVDSGPAALAAMGDVLGATRTGGTDIEQALLSSFDLIHEEGGRDPDLARAQIVLVTDGDAEVREPLVREARERAGRVPVQVSVIALGEENPTLRALVARQRSRGERAFYHHMDDAALRDLCEQRLDRAAAIHLPASRADLRRSTRAAKLHAELGALLDELGALERPALPPEADQARREALDRHHRALSARFARWFPKPLATPSAPASEATPPGPPPGTPEHDDLEATHVVLTTIAEVLREPGGSRRADAIEILERLLPDARLSPARYHAALRDHPAHLAAPLRAIHTAVALLQPPRRRA